MSSLNAENALIFRITHIDNIPWILDHGLHCRNMTERDPNFVEIGHPELIQKRAHRQVPIPPGGVLSDYIPFVFTDRHAYLQLASFFSDLARLDCIPWELLRNRDFKRDVSDPGKFERYQAEALVHRCLPVTGLSGIMCYEDAQKTALQAEVGKRRQSLQVVVKPDCYF